MASFILYGRKAFNVHHIKHIYKFTGLFVKPLNSCSMNSPWRVPVNFFSFSPVSRILVADPQGTCTSRVSVTAAIVPVALLLRALPLPLPLSRRRCRRSLPVPRTLLYCYYNDTLLCLNIWVRILLKPYSVCGGGPAELVKTPINIYYGKPTSDIVYMVFNEFKRVNRGQKNESFL